MMRGLKDGSATVVSLEVVLSDLPDDEGTEANTLAIRLVSPTLLSDLPDDEGTEGMACSCTAAW
jgi:hypothetical protein